MARAGNTSTAHVVITMEGKQALDFMKQLQQQAQHTRQELQQMEAAGQQGTDDYKDKVEELKRLERAVQQNRSAYIDLNQVVNNLQNTSLLKLQKALKEVRKQMYALDPEKLAREGRNYRQELSRLQAQYTAIDNQIGELTGQWRRQDGAIMSVIKRLTAYVSVYGGFNMVTNQLGKMFSSNMEFSDQLADIRKTTGLSTQAVNELSAAIMNIDTRSSVQELHNLAYEAGRLGIGNQGADAVLGFVRAADKLNVALKEDLGDDAIIQLTKMADVMGLTKKMGVEKSLLSIGSAINELAQNSTANGEYITDYAARLSGIATAAHMTVDELLGLAAASDATGQEVEVSATAMNRFVVQLQDHYKTVAKATGINEDALHKMLTMGKTTEAVVTVLEALNKKGGLSLIAPIMEDLGSNGSRLTGVLTNLSMNIDLVKKQLDISKEAFEENISVTNEFNIRNETAAAIMERMKNSWDKMFTNSQNVGVVRDLAQEMYELSNTLQQNSLFLGTLNAAMNTLIFTIKALLAMSPYLVAFFSMKGLILLASNIKANIVPALRNLGMAFSGAGVAATGAAAATTRFGAAVRGVTALLKSNVFILAASVIAAIAYKLIQVSQELTLAEKNLQSFNEGVKDFEKTSHAAGIEANILFNRLKEADKGSKERRKLMTQINEQYGKYLPNLLTEKSSLEEIATAQETVNTKLRQALALKAKNQAMDEAGQMFTPKMAEATSRLQEIYTGAKIGGVGENDIQFLIKRTQQLYDAGKSYAEIKQQVWDELYRVDEQFGYSGRSAELVAARKVKKDSTYQIDEDKENKNRGLLRSQMGNMQEAVNQYIANFWNQNKAIERASKKYDPLIGDYTEKIDDGAPYTIVEAEDDKKKRAALKAAKDEYKAIMAAIEVFYKQQEQVVNENYLKKKITTTQREQEIADIQDRFRRSRIAADEALLDRPGAHTAWNQELQRMEKENISLTEDTTQALDNLWSKNLKSIGDKLRKFGDGEMDGIWKNLETDKTKIQEQAIKLAQEVEKIINQYDFEAQVTEKFIAAMQKLKIFFPQLTDNMKEGSEKAMEGLHSIYPKLFSIDINTDEGLASFRKLLQEAGGLGEQMLKLEGEKLQLLYYKTLEYGDAMVEAQKKARDRGVKVGTAAYQQSDQYKQDKQRISTNEKTVDVYKSAEALGLASDIMVQDQEVKLYEARLEAAKNYYEYLQSTGRDTTEAEIQLQEATSELAAALVEKTKEQFDVLRSYGKNFEDFGADFGEAVFGSITDRQDAFEDFVKAIGKTTQELIMNWVKQKIEHAILRKAMIKTEEESQEEMTNASKKGSKDESKAIEKGGKDVLKTMARAAKKRAGLLKEEKKEEVKVEEQGQEQQTALVEAGGEIQAAVTDQIGNAIVSKKKQQAAENVSTEASETSANATMGIASAAAKTLGELGWWGIPLVAVVTALINGLLSAAMSKVGSLFSGSEAKGATAPTKLVTGMLTYDSGNVQSVLGSDGHVYSARVGGVNGSGIVSVPTLTNVNGQAALVGEQGPEIVIGRATTRALMQNNPGLLAGLVQFDKMYSGRGFRTYAGGNVQQYGANGEPISPEEQERQQLERIMSVVTATLLPTLEGIDRSLAASNRTNAALHERLKQPINATINKYGRGGLVDEVASGLEQEKKSGRNDTVRRLFGSR